jgi:alkanesulfonate monooxygenase SsuD/methylene tetrahydromethanopterin reductase-like flavin-dependent oxidoreductase (luciferase family)
MKFGYILENFGDDLQPDTLIESVQLAEDMGFSSAWATDHIIRPKENN